jgi:hypothetical protein
VKQPNLRELKQAKTPEYAFSVDAYLMREAIKPFKKLGHVAFHFDTDELVIDPRHEEFESVRVPIFNLKGKPETTVHDFESVKAFFESYEGTLTVLHQKFKNIIGEEGFMWWSHEREKLAMVAGVTEPDYHSAWQQAYANAPA